MILNASQWSNVVNLADFMRQLFDMPEDTMQVEVTESATTIKGYSLDSEVTLTIKSKKPQN